MIPTWIRKSAQRYFWFHSHEYDKKRGNLKNILCQDILNFEFCYFNAVACLVLVDQLLCIFLSYDVSAGSFRYFEISFKNDNRKSEVYFFKYFDISYFWAIFCRFFFIGFMMFVIIFFAWVTEIRNDSDLNKRICRAIFLIS